VEKAAEDDGLYLPEARFDRRVTGRVRPDGVTHLIMYLGKGGRNWMLFSAPFLPLKIKNLAALTIFEVPNGQIVLVVPRLGGWQTKELGCTYIYVVRPAWPGFSPSNVLVMQVFSFVTDKLYF
jgi:hypothetical protein